MKHVIWPEGQPSQAVRTQSGIVATLTMLRMQIIQLFPLTKTRRIRHARSEGDYADPAASEMGLQLAGAIAPPGGWPSATTGGKKT